MLKDIGLIFALSVFVYTIFPTFLARICHLGVIWRFPRGTGQVAITFDDGPDPRYTPQVLEILKRYKVNACFFLLGEKARAHPELVKEILHGGHQIGCHGYKHHLAWLLTPRATRTEIECAKEAFLEVTGRTPKFYRPPWGVFNLYSFLKAKKVRPVLWSFMSRDWERNATPPKLTQRVLKKIRDGAILIFHDSDATIGAASGAPENMLRSLPVILEEIEKRNLKVVPLPEADRANIFKIILRKLWQLWEKLFQRLARIRKVENSLFRVALRKYHGPALTLPDGTSLQKGDRIIELHLDNDRLSLITGSARSEIEIGVRVLKEARCSLPILARWLNANSEFTCCRVLMGITLLNRGIKGLGFTSCDLSSGFLRRITLFYQRWLLYLYHPGGQQRLSKHKDKLEPKMVIISQKDLIRRYDKYTKEV